MANKATITYNGKDVLTEEKEGNFDVLYKENVIATLGAGQSKTLFCKNKVMRSDIKIGSKTLFCKAKKMYSDIKIMVESLFPPKPSSYDLIATYTSSQTWSAPETGHYQIEVFGASGSGGHGTVGWLNQNGAGGGGGGYSCSKDVPLNKGDTIVLTIGGVGSTTSAAVNSSHDNSFDHTLQVTSGVNGEDAITFQSLPIGGAGGDASGGKTANIDGGKGFDGGEGGAGGAAGYSGGNNGGAGGKGKEEGSNAPGALGKAGFVKIYQGK